MGEREGERDADPGIREKTKRNTSSKGYNQVGIRLPFPCCIYLLASGALQGGAQKVRLPTSPNIDLKVHHLVWRLAECG